MNQEWMLKNRLKGGNKIKSFIWDMKLRYWNAGEARGMVFLFLKNSNINILLKNRIEYRVEFV